MARTHSLAWSQLKIGILGVAALALTSMLILAVGGQGGFAWQRYALRTTFADVAGLKTGAVVRVAGVDVGKVDGSGRLASKNDIPKRNSMKPTSTIKIRTPISTNTVL